MHGTQVNKVKVMVYKCATHPDSYRDQLNKEILLITK